MLWTSLCEKKTNKAIKRNEIYSNCLKHFRLPTHYLIELDYFWRLFIGFQNQYDILTWRFYLTFLRPSNHGRLSKQKRVDISAHFFRSSMLQPRGCVPKALAWPIILLFVLRLVSSESNKNNIDSKSYNLTFNNGKSIN